MMWPPHVNAHNLAMLTSRKIKDVCIDDTRVELICGTSSRKSGEASAYLLQKGTPSVLVIRLLQGNTETRNNARPTAPT